MTVSRLLSARCFVACFALACLSGILAAQPRMALVGPGVGWTLLSQGTAYSPNDRLFWTNDDGANWKDVTPNDPASRQIAGVFFLDASRGWVLLALKRQPPKNNQEPSDFITDIRGFDLASTPDGGASWTFKHLDSLAEGVGWVAASEIFFLDTAHGWMNIESPVPHWGGEGVLLATADGGNTWKQIVEVNGGGGYGPIRFTDPLNGWIAGGPGDQYLYATSDGGRHWREAAVPAPPAIAGLFEDQAPLYTSPKFKDSRHGLLPVKYSGPGKSGDAVSIQALLSTNDGGNTWHLESWSNLDQAADLPIVAVVDSVALAPKRVDHEPATLLKLEPGGKVSETRASQSPEVPSGAALLSLSFSDVAHGWASSSDGRLLSTSDGGTVWKDITPSRKKTSTQPASSPVVRANPSSITLQSSVVASAVLGPIATTSTISTYKSRHLGFDLCQAPADSPQMSTWWTSSPYFDIGIYVGGSTRTCSQPNLISRWVTNVIGQGWGLIPLWPGPQVPCTCVPVQNGNNTWPNCTKFWGAYISTSGGAYAQGQTEADAATKGSKSAMQKLGLGAGSVIYYDIENYTPSATWMGNAAGSYVNSFLSGWVNELHSNGYIAGVYGNGAPASTWFAGGTGYSAVSPSPDDVFIANYNNANYNLTIWGLGFTDSAWTQDQRMHQFAAGQNQTWGGQQLNIDNDIEDADVTGGNGTKSYSFTYSPTLDFFGAGYTFPQGINNFGQIVGWYADPTGPGRHGFIDTSGNAASFDCLNATGTFAVGINNAGQVVGYYADSAGVSHGFLYQAGFCTILDYSNATNTYAVGINDDSEISGFFTDSLGVYHGFLYQAGNFGPPIDYPGATGTELGGINGDAQIAGICPNGDCPAFLYAQGTYIYPPVQGLGGVNNNEQVQGSIGQNVVFEHEGNSITIACPGGSHTNPATGSNDFTLNSQTAAKVAIVGSCVISGVVHGFLATSQ